jgi:hypothetical protein
LAGPVASGPYPVLPARSSSAASATPASAGGASPAAESAARIGIAKYPREARGCPPPGIVTSGRPRSLASAAKAPPEATHTGAQPRSSATAVQASVSSVSPE